MASPQKENGFTPIANEIIDAFAKINLSPYEWRVIFTVIRFSYGWNKKEANLTYSKIESFSGIKKCHISRAINSLLQKKIIEKKEKGYRLQKDYERWGVPVEEVPILVTKSSSAGNSRVPVEELKTAKKANKNKDLQTPKDIFKDIYINTSLKAMHSFERERENLEKKVKEIFPNCVSIPKSIPDEKLFLLVHKVNMGEIKAENIKSPIAYLVGMKQENIEPLLASERHNIERLRVEKIQRKKLIEEQKKEKEINKEEISFKIKEFVANLNKI